jgi:hypothetical protein
MNNNHIVERCRKWPNESQDGHMRAFVIGQCLVLRTNIVNEHPVDSYSKGNSSTQKLDKYEMSHHFC